MREYVLGAITQSEQAHLLPLLLLFIHDLLPHLSLLFYQLGQIFIHIHLGGFDNILSHFYWLALSGFGQLEVHLIVFLFFLPVFRLTRAVVYKGKAASGRMIIDAGEGGRLCLTSQIYRLVCFQRRRAARLP